MNSSSSLPTTTTAPAASQAQASQNGKKRKAVSQLALLHKRIRQNLITCPVAISFLRNLGFRHRSTFNSGKFLAWTVDPTDPIFQTIHKYVSNGQPGKELASWHPHQFGIKVLGILRVTPGGIPPQFDNKPANRGQLRMMLWKGGRAIDARNALKNGLKFQRARPSQKWGEGYYFDDSISNALEWGYDRRYMMEGEEVKDMFQTGNIAYLFLCEVLLGNDMYLTYTTEKKGPTVTPQQSWWARLASQQLPKPIKVKSIKCEGKWVPDPRGNDEIDGCVWPLGERIYNYWSLSLAKFWYKFTTIFPFWGNHYMVYEESRVIPRFLVKVEVTEGTVREKIN